MRKFLWALVVPIAFVAVVGCRQPLSHPIDCDSVLALRLGQSPQEAEALLGRPIFAALQKVVHTDGHHRTETDTVWLYNNESGRFVRDRFSVDFFEQKLVWASADRRYGVGWAKRIAPAYDLSPWQQPQLNVGPAFESVFTCRPGFSRDEAIKHAARQQ